MNGTVEMLRDDVRREAVVLVEEPSERRAARARALSRGGAVVFTVDDCDDVVEVLRGLRGGARVLLVDVAAAAESELRTALNALSPLLPVAVDAIAGERLARVA
jgi:hypothetical protein